MELRFKEYFHPAEEREHIAAKGYLQCSCGSRIFAVRHSGRQTKGILAPYIAEVDHQVRIEAVCAACGQRIPLLDSTIDGLTPRPADLQPLTELVCKGQRQFPLEAAFNYWEEADYMTNLFFTFHLFGKSDSGKRLVLYESV